MPVARSTRVLTESRVREIISAVLRKEVRKSFSSNLTDILSVNLPIVIDNPSTPAAAVGFDLTALTTTATPLLTDEIMIYDVDLTTERKIALSALQGIIDHGSIAGLGDDDHNDATNGYILRELTGTVTDNALARWDLTGGRNLQDSGWILDNLDELDAGGNNLRHIGAMSFDSAFVSTVERGLIDNGATILFTTSSVTRMTLSSTLLLEVDLDMFGNDIVGYAPKESHIDFIALAAEHAFS